MRSPEVHFLADGGGLLHTQFVARGEQESTLREEVVLTDLRVSVAVVLPVGGALLIQTQHRAALGRGHVFLALRTAALFRLRHLL